MGASVWWSEKRGAQEGARGGATSSIFTKKGRRDGSSQNRFMTG